MMPQPDKLFRDRLEHFKKSPPPQAWNRVNSGLYTRKSKSLWISIAAGVVILIGASFLFWQSNETPQVLASITVKPEVQPTQENQPATSTISSTSEPTPSPITSSVKRNINHSGNAVAVNPTTETAQLVETHSQEKSIAETEINSSPVSEPIAANDMQSSSPRSNKIVYSSNEVNSRFLKKESAPQEAIPQESTPPAPFAEKAETPIQRILDIASGLRNEDASLSDLREIKNEYLSIPIKGQTKDK